MGTSTGIARGQLRPHFAGRSPPFIVAALCVGLGILAVSYYSLSTQYTNLQNQLENFVRNDETNKYLVQEKSRDLEMLQKKNTELKARLQTQDDLIKLKDANVETIKKEKEQMKTEIEKDKEKHLSLTKQNEELQSSINQLNMDNNNLKKELELLKKSIQSKSQDQSTVKFVKSNAVANESLIEEMKKANLTDTKSNVKNPPDDQVKGEANQDNDNKISSPSDKKEPIF